MSSVAPASGVFGCGCVVWQRQLYRHAGCQEPHRRCTVQVQANRAPSAPPWVLPTDPPDPD